MMRFEIRLSGPFTLILANEYFGGWPSVGPDQSALALTFPVEGWRTSAAVAVSQDREIIRGEVFAAGEDAARAWQQALATLSLDQDASKWPEVGQRDPVLGRLQRAYQFLRPVLFHSPYEAAAAFIIGHRISIQQGRAIRQAMARELGEHIQVGETLLHAFPRPQVLRDLTSFKGLSTEKIQRLQGVAQAALDGVLDRTSLRSMPVEQAVASLRSLRGVGAFFAQGIVLRGAGGVDEVTDDDVTKEAVQLAYKLTAPADQPEVLQIAETWRPYRMWAIVLLHVWLRREAGGPHRSSARRRR